MPLENEKIYTVTELNQNLRACIQAGFPERVWITGEIEDFRGYKQGSAVYFLLKDGNSALRMVWWTWNLRQGLPLGFQNGVAVEVYGKVDVYAARGECQISVEALRLKGEGAEMLKLKALREKLGQEGLFNPSRKKPLPAFPKYIGLITAEGAAAMGDFMKGLGNRQGALTVLFFPAIMQGKNAPLSIIAQLGYINQYNLCEVIVITRGGGSKEDLTAFNDEGLARAIASSQIPVISAVGHQQDYTICDEVADLRAMTPTDAAKYVVQEATRVRERISYCANNIVQQQRFRISQLRERLSAASHDRYLASPMTTIVQPRQAYITQLTQRIQGYPQHLCKTLELRVQAATNGITNKIPLILPERKTAVENFTSRLLYFTENTLRSYKERLKSATDKLQLLGPQAVLERGYAIVFNDNGEVMQSTTTAKTGDNVKIRLAQGEMTATISNIN